MAWSWKVAQRASFKSALGSFPPNPHTTHTQRWLKRVCLSQKCWKSSAKISICREPLSNGLVMKGCPKGKLQICSRFFPSVGCFIYNLDSSNSSSIKFWSSQFGSSSKSNWTRYSNGSWTDKQSSHFSAAKEMSVYFSCKKHNKQILIWCWNVVEILLNWSFANDELTITPIPELNC